MPLSELVSSHTARRSFATNAFNAGVPAITIMSVTGHLTESAFMKYIKTDPEAHALRMAESALFAQLIKSEK